MPAGVVGCSEGPDMQGVTDSCSLCVLSQTAAGAEQWHSRMQTGGKKIVICLLLLHIERLDTYALIPYIHRLNSYSVGTDRTMQNSTIKSDYKELSVFVDSSAPFGQK